jgi:hypothetical protein
MARSKEVFKGYNALSLYSEMKMKRNYHIIGAKDIEGEKIHSLEEWNAHAYKAEIEEDVKEFKKFLRQDPSVQDIADDYITKYFLGVQFKGVILNTPILYDPEREVGDIQDLILAFSSAIEGENKYGVEVPDILKSELGNKILHDLKSTTYSPSVFCHCYLNYKSLVLQDNKLIGITNWQYAGYYPPEFESIIEKYMEHFI